MEANVAATTEVIPSIDHHHDATGELVPMRRMSLTFSDPKRRPADMPDDTGWSREVWECPCGERVTLLIRVKTTVD